MACKAEQGEGTHNAFRWGRTMCEWVSNAALAHQAGRPRSPQPSIEALKHISAQREVARRCSFQNPFSAADDVLADEGTVSSLTCFRTRLARSPVASKPRGCRGHADLRRSVVCSTTLRRTSLGGQSYREDLWGRPGGMPVFPHPLTWYRRTGALFLQC